MLCGCLLFGCSGEITSLSTEYTVIDLAVGSVVDMSDYVTIEGNGIPDYAIENVDVLSLKGSKVTALKEGQGAVIISSGDFVVRIVVVVTDRSNLVLTMSDTTCYYDGKSHFVTINESLPKGTQVTYYCNGEIFNGATNAGEYEINAEVVLPKGYSIKGEMPKATLTINKANYDFSGVHFGQTSFTYDGEEKTVSLVGALPSGMTVTYENNSAIDAGTYNARAIFNNPDPTNYEDPTPMSTTLTIAKNFIDIRNNGFRDTVYSYDGQEHTLFIKNLPDLVTVEYYQKIGDNLQKVDMPTSYKNVGVYEFYAKLTTTETVLKNHTFTCGNGYVEFTDGVSELQKATLTINRAILNVNGKWRIVNNNKEVSEIVYGKSIGFGLNDSYDYSIYYDYNEIEGENKELLGKVNALYVSSDNFIPNVYGYYDVNLYSVNVNFVLPSEYEDNYQPFSANFNFDIVRATVDISSVTFNTDIKEVTFDENASYDFEVNLNDNAFLAQNATVKYKYKYNGNVELDYVDGCVYHAGTYVIIAKFTLNNDTANYNPISSVRYQFTIKPYVVELGNITFESFDSITYDGNNHVVEIVGSLPTDVSVEYVCNNETNNVFVNAGTYVINANFYYKKDVLNKVDYVIKIDGIEKKSLITTLTINKANYENLDTAIYTQSGEIEYGDVLAVGEVVLNNNDNNVVKWTVPNTKITVQRIDEVDDNYGYMNVPCYYNADPTNYNDYRFAIELKITRKVIDTADIILNDQFIAYAGKKLSPYFEYDYANDITVEFTTNVVDIGKYNPSLKITLKDEKNCKLVGNDLVEGLFVYVYNKANFTYEVGSTKLEKYSGSNDKVEVIDGTTYIKSGAFSGNVKEITIPDSVVDMAFYALGKVEYLEKLSLPSATYVHIDKLTSLFSSLVLPESLSTVIIRNDTAILDNAFSYMSNLKYVIYEQEIASIGTTSFDGCTSLIELTSGDFDKLESVGQNAFRGCSSIKTLHLPSLGSEILSYYVGSYSACSPDTVVLHSTDSYALVKDAFKNSGVDNIVFSSGLSGLGVYAFSGISAELNFSNTSLTEIGEYAFSGYLGEKITLKEGITTIGRYAFSSMPNVKNINIPSSVTVIMNNAFDGTSAELIFVENSLYTEIGESAFENYQGSAFNFDKITKIGKNAFKNSALTSIDVNVDLGEGAFYGCKELESVNLGDNVTNIGAYAFYSCEKILVITIPQNVVKVGDFAFRYCKGIVTINFLSALPPTPASSVYLTEGILLSINVPNQTIDAYREYLDACGTENKYLIS